MSQIKRFGRTDAFVGVDDGWMIGFNRGEFGAALYWFSHDGARNYRISDHHLVGFFQLPNGLHAIEGSSHLGAARGSVIRIAPEPANGRWHAQTTIRLPDAPEAVAVKSDGTMLITLSDALVSIDARGRLRKLIADAPWPTLYPNSSTLSADEQHLYIGMRQYVAEVDLKTRALRFLIPSLALIHKLSRDEERQIRGYLMLRVVRPG